MFERLKSIFHPIVIYHFPEHQLKMDMKDSFWYDGHTATVYYLLRKAIISAEGEIKVRDKKGELIYCNGKEYGKGLKAKNDTELYALSEKNKITFECNNWFEVYIGNDDSEIYGSVEDAIEGAKSIVHLSYSLSYLVYVLNRLNFTF
jgi:hypothetical protein